MTRRRVIVIATGLVAVGAMGVFLCMPMPRHLGHDPKCPKLPAEWNGREDACTSDDDCVVTHWTDGKCCPFPCGPGEVHSRAFAEAVYKQVTSHCAKSACPNVLCAFDYPSKVIPQWPSCDHGLCIDRRFPPAPDTIVPQVLPPLQGVAETKSGFVLARSVTSLHVIDLNTWRVRFEIPIPEPVHVRSFDQLIPAVAGDVPGDLGLALGVDTREPLKNTDGVATDTPPLNVWPLKSGALIIETDQSVELWSPSHAKVAEIAKSPDAWSIVDVADANVLTEWKSSLDLWNLKTGRWIRTVKPPFGLKAAKGVGTRTSVHSFSSLRCDRVFWVEHRRRDWLMHLQQLSTDRVLRRFPTRFEPVGLSPDCAKLTVTMKRWDDCCSGDHMYQTGDLDLRTGQIANREVHSHPLRRPTDNPLLDDLPTKPCLRLIPSPDATMTVRLHNGEIQVGHVLFASTWQHDCQDTHAVWRADSQWLAVAAGRDLILWNKSTPTVLRQLSLPAGTDDAQFLEGGALLTLRSRWRVGIVRVSDGAYLEHWQMPTAGHRAGFFVSGRDWSGDDAAAALLLFRSGPDIATATLLSLDRADGVRRVESMLEAFAKGDVHGQVLPQVSHPVADPASSVDPSAPQAGKCSLSKSDIARAMKTVQPRVRECYRQYKVPGRVNVTISVDGGGRVFLATVTGKLAGTPSGACVERAVEAAKFSPCEATSFPWSFQLY